MVTLGLWLSFRSRFVQIRRFPAVVRRFLGYIGNHQEKSDRGVHPLIAFFASVGGCIGIGNLVAICTAVQIGGPGALFWVWMTGILGMLVKYAEVFLGMRYRIQSGDGYVGGPMYFLGAAFGKLWIPQLVALLLCIYGVEIYQFRVVTSVISHNFAVPEWFSAPVFIAMILFAGLGGVQRVGKISSLLIPLFVLLYCGMGIWVLGSHLREIPSLLWMVLTSAFTGHAAVGGFVGSTLAIALSQGVRRACYTGDLGVGYASVIHSESSVTEPEKQASLVIFDIFLDTFVICTTTLLLILVTGVWSEPIHQSLLVQTALEKAFPYMHLFMPIFLFLLGYSTINAFFVVGLKSAEYLFPNQGKRLFLIYSVGAFILFSLFDAVHAQTLMTISGGLLLVINGLGIFRLGRQVTFDF